MATKKQGWKQLKLVVTKGQKRGEEFKLDKPTLGIGRSNINQIVLEDPGVSPFHARVIVEGQTCIITDLGAHEGMKVNSKKVETKVLAPGDKIELGETLLEVVRSTGWRAEPRTRKEIKPARKVRLRIPIRFSLLVILLIILLAAIAAFDVHWLNQILGWGSKSEGGMRAVNILRRIFGLGIRP